MNFARVDVNFQTTIVINLAVVFFFHINITEHQYPTNNPDKISAKYTKPFWRKR